MAHPKLLHDAINAGYVCAPLILASLARARDALPVIRLEHLKEGLLGCRQITFSIEQAIIEATSEIEASARESD